MKTLLKWLATAFVGFIALGIVIDATKTPEQKAAEAAAKAQQQAQAAQQQQEHAQQELATLQTVNAHDIAKAYYDNTVAADQQFKNQKLKVFGSIDSISTDFSGDPVITLRGGINPFMEPMLKFDAAASGQIAKLKKGAKITVICTGGGDIGKTPMLNDCIIP
jgi:tRNA_anti-like